MTKTNTDLVYKICSALRPQAGGATANISRVWTAEHHGQFVEKLTCLGLNNYVLGPFGQPTLTNMLSKRIF